MCDDLLTPAEAGQMLGKSGETLRRWAALDRIPHIRYPSGQIRFRRADVEAILKPKPVAS